MRVDNRCLDRRAKKDVGSASQIVLPAAAFVLVHQRGSQQVRQRPPGFDENRRMNPSTKEMQMSKSNSGSHFLLNRREVLRLSATAGLGAALCEPGRALDSTKTAAHQEPGNCS